MAKRQDVPRFSFKFHRLPTKTTQHLFGGSRPLKYDRMRHDDARRKRSCCVKAYTRQDRIAVVSSVKGKHGETTRYAMLFFQDFLITDDATAKPCRCVKAF